MEAASAAPDRTSLPAETSGGGSRRPRILVGLSGSVASIKADLLVAGLLDFADVRVIATKSAEHFIRDLSFPQVLKDEDEWSCWSKREDPVLHIDLRKWADVLLVAPLSANTLAKLANGLCDNLLTCVARAWDFSRPLLVAPAMNTLMWESPFTAKHLRELEGLGVRVVPPVAKRLVCGDVGTGAMAEVPTLVEAARAACEGIRQKGLLADAPAAAARTAAHSS